MTSAEFKQALPEFASSDDTRISYWLDLDDDEKPTPGVWGGLYVRGVSNWVAFNLTVEAQRAAAMAAGAAAAGFATEEQVGLVRVKYSEKQVEASLSDPYKANGYGIEFLRLQRMAGAGAVCV